MSLFRNFLKRSKSVIKDNVESSTDDTLTTGITGTAEFREEQKKEIQELRPMTTEEISKIVQQKKRSEQSYLHHLKLSRHHRKRSDMAYKTIKAQRIRKRLSRKGK